jgi:hypothetical protein
MNILLGIKSGKKTKPRSRVNWHRRWIILRFIKLGGRGTPHPSAQRVFIFIGRLWARNSPSKGWLFSNISPVSVQRSARP